MAYVIVRTALVWNKEANKYEDETEETYEDTRTDKRTQAFWHLVSKCAQTQSLGGSDTMEALRFRFLELGQLPHCNGYAVRETR